VKTNLTKSEISKLFNLSKSQTKKIDEFINEIINYNSHTNIVGKSTLGNPWKRHVLDCLQIKSLIKDMDSSILDLGTGAGLPGIVMSISGFSNISMIDSNSKKISFVKNVCKKLNIKAKIYNERIENLNFKFNFLVARAIANLNKLLFYSQKLFSNDTQMILLKSENINNEISAALKNWSFKYSIKNSISDSRGRLITIQNLRKTSE
tara:strand:- start:291 stop:911 length:621 start_codon:yes stop_codon:yes gene_type:complete